MSIDYAKARETMVEQQVRPWDVLDVRVLDAIATIPREAFVPEALRALAYADTALPIGHGELMMKPVLEGRTLQSLLPAANECVLEIGTGSGYLTACLARLAREVVSLERHADLADNLEEFPSVRLDLRDRCGGQAAKRVVAVVETRRPPVRRAGAFTGDGCRAHAPWRQRNRRSIVVRNRSPVSGRHRAAT
jgi:protein-L-isoaspartate(D-aspartate) O-methyltransferase